MLRSRNERQAAYPYENNKPKRNIVMSTSEASFQDQRRRSLFVAAALAFLGIGAVACGLHSRRALAEPEPSVSRAETPTIEQSVQLRVASADADFGPGHCEPCVVSLQWHLGPSDEETHP
jgi:hypothetical protein